MHPGRGMPLSFSDVLYRLNRVEVHDKPPRATKPEYRIVDRHEWQVTGNPETREFKPHRDIHLTVYDETVAPLWRTVGSMYTKAHRGATEWLYELWFRPEVTIGEMENILFRLNWKIEPARDDETIPDAEASDQPAGVPTP